METNVELFNYGIHTEKSDVRAHVSFAAKKVFVFKTLKGLEAIQKHSLKVAEAFQPGVNGSTAAGYLCPPDLIDDIRRIRLAPYRFTGWKFDATTSDKGKWAVEIVVELAKAGRFPIWVSVRDDERESIQIKGTDIVVFARQHIQVKCDWRAGDKTKDGTMCSGYLFLQIAERNPLKRI